MSRAQKDSCPGIIFVQHIQRLEHSTICVLRLAGIEQCFQLSMWFDVARNGMKSRLRSSESEEFVAKFDIFLNARREGMSHLLTDYVLTAVVTAQLFSAPDVRLLSRGIGAEWRFGIHA
jgi:hypothetical protein